MTLLSVAIAEEDSPDLVPILLSYFHLSLDKTSERTISNIEYILEEGRKYLDR